MRLWRLTGARMIRDWHHSWDHYGLAIRVYGPSHWGYCWTCRRRHCVYDEIAHVWQIIPGIVVFFDFKRGGDEAA